MSVKERKIGTDSRNMMKQRIMVEALLVLLLFSLPAGSFTPRHDFDSRLKSIVKPYQFSTVKWEAKAIPGELKQSFMPHRESPKNEIAAVEEYFSLTQQIKALKSNNPLGPSPEAELNRLQEQKSALADTVERILEKQIGETLDELGIFSRVAGLRVDFPPVNFKLETPPYLLVISPRDRIESIQTVTLQSTLTRKEIGEIESGADALGVSALVVGLGGLGTTYPTFVADDTSLKSVIETGVHEWLHQYLAFKPLGFYYVLDLTGLRRDYDVAMMNETLADMLGKEIGDLVYEKYYASPAGAISQNPLQATTFNFNREMRETRQTVDSYLTRGEIEQAEQFMKERRDFLATKGYNIRKLNQAYFAFYGTYADSPTSIDPIGSELKELRAKSGSLKDFLGAASRLTSRQQLEQSIK